MKQTLSGKYADAEPDRRADGTWSYEYAKQSVDAFGSQQVTNGSLIRCAADRVPVAVLVQTRAKGPALYEVLGLAQVTGWDGSFFRFEGYNDAGELGRLQPVDQSVRTDGFSDNTLPHDDFQPMTPEDWRKKVNAEITVRQGGKGFRDNALADFDVRCVLTGCTEPGVLEAAHIVPYLGEHTNKRDNALLLRADLHILFDREVFSIDPDLLTIKVVKPSLSAHYGFLDGFQIKLPKAVDGKRLGQRLTERDAFLAIKASAKSSPPKAE